MGFNIKTSELLILSKQANINFEKVVTIGRQQLNGSQLLFEKLFRQYGFSLETYNTLMKSEGRYGENFLRLLGAQTVDSIDASDYEKASIIHDMNNPVPGSLKERYSVVIDSGSLEHIFNYPVAIKNCMEMVRTGGHFIGISPANNFLGHGFFQFSPELFYRVFSPENGFKAMKMLLFFNDHRSPVFEVRDPLQVRERVTLKNTRETYLFFLARREEAKPVLLTPPQQSDYFHISWTNKKQQDKSVLKSSVAKKIKKFIPKVIVIFFLTMRKVILNLSSITSPIGNGEKKFFKRIKSTGQVFSGI